MIRTLNSIGMLISFGLSSGCAAIVNAQYQTISIDTPGCSPAHCQLSNDKGTWFVTTPGYVTVRRACGNMNLICIKDEYMPVTRSVSSRTNVMPFGNIPLGGMVGAGIEIGTGTVYGYPELIAIPLACGPDAHIGKTGPLESVDVLPNGAPSASGASAK